MLKKPLTKRQLFDKWWNYTKRTELLGSEKVLLVLPCNAGWAISGSYFDTGPNKINIWRHCDRLLRPIRSKVLFAVVETPTLEESHDKNLSCLGFEHEFQKRHTYWNKFGKIDEESDSERNLESSSFQVNDEVFAPWSDGENYKAIVTDTRSNGTLTVTFQDDKTVLRVPTAKCWSVKQERKDNGEAAELANAGLDNLTTAPKLDRLELFIESLTRGFKRAKEEFGIQSACCMLTPFPYRVGVWSALQRAKMDKESVLLNGTGQAFGAVGPHLTAVLLRSNNNPPRGVITHKSLQFRAIVKTKALPKQYRYWEKQTEWRCQLITLITSISTHKITVKELHQAYNTKGDPYYNICKVVGSPIDCLVGRRNFNRLLEEQRLEPKESGLFAL